MCAARIAIPITEQKLRTNRPDNRNDKCGDSNKPDRHNSFSRFTVKYIIFFVRSSSVESVSLSEVSFSIIFYNIKNVTYNLNYAYFRK